VRQQVSAPSDADCDNWRIEICKGPATGAGSLGCAAADTTCGPLYYAVYLVRVGNAGGGPLPDLTFKAFSVSGSLLSIGQFAIVPAQGSKFDTGLSLQCSPPDINQNGGTFRADGDQFGYVVTPENGTITWQVNGRRLLFVLAVDAFLNHTVSLGNLKANFAIPNSEAGTTDCPMMVQDCNGGEDYAQSLTAPAVCSGDFFIRLSTPLNMPTAMHPYRRRVAVYVTASLATTLNITDLELLLELSSGNLIVPHQIVSGLVSDIKVYDTHPLLKRIYVNSGAVSVTASTAPTTANTLFYIYLNGPVLSAACANTTIRLNYANLALIGNGCCGLEYKRSAVDNFSNRIVGWGGQPCPLNCSNFNMSVVAKQRGCQELYFALQVSSATAPRVLAGIEVSLDVRFNKGGNLIWSAGLSQGINCGQMTCVTSIPLNDSTLRLVYSMNSAISLNTPNDPLGLVNFGFSGSSACIQDVRFSNAAIRIDSLNTLRCIPTVSSSIQAGNPSTHLCLDQIEVRYALEDGKIPGDEVQLGITNCLKKNITGGSYSACNACSPGNHTLTLYNNTNWLNGITTLDLALISRHILNIEPLPTPYRMIAADANKTGTITTVDIVALRRLILGIDDSISTNNITSFRFVDKSFVFPNPNNPFQTAFSEAINFNIGVSVAFVAIKVGDVNLSYTPRQMPQTLGYTVPTARSGERVEIPVFARDSTNYTGWQMAFNYDTTLLKLSNILWIGEKSPHQDRGWHEPQKGRVRLLCYDVEGGAMPFSPGNPLFYAQFQAKKPLQGLGRADAPPLLWVGEGIPSEAYTAGGSLSRLSLLPSDLSVIERDRTSKPTTPAPSCQIEVYPNPAQSNFRIDIWSPEAGPVLATITDLWGRSIAQQSFSLATGLNTFTAAQMTTALVPGQYIITVDTNSGRQVKRLLIR